MAEAKKTTKRTTAKTADKVTQTPSLTALADGKKLKGLDGRGVITPAAVSRVYSSRGLEYLFMVISLFALSLGVILLGNDIIMYFFDSSAVSGPLGEWAGLEALTVVGAAFFFYLWSRLRAAEEISPVVLLDPSRKRAIQRGLIAGFIALLASSFGFIYVLFEILSDGQDIVKSDWSSIVSSLYTLGIVGLAFNFLFNQERKGE